MAEIRQFSFWWKNLILIGRLCTRVGHIRRFVHVAPRSLCPGPNRPLDTKKVVGNTGNHLRSKPKIWIFVDFQAKSRLYAITETIKLHLIYHYNQTYIWLHLPQFSTRRSLYGFSNHFYSKNFEILRNLCLLTLIIRGLIAIKLQVLGGGGCQASKLKILVSSGLLDLNDLI